MEGEIRLTTKVFYLLNINKTFRNWMSLEVHYERHGAEIQKVLGKAGISVEVGVGLSGSSLPIGGGAEWILADQYMAPSFNGGFSLGLPLDVHGQVSYSQVIDITEFVQYWEKYDLGIIGVLMASVFSQTNLVNMSKPFALFKGALYA